MKITRRKITAAVNPWKTKYQIHWMSPDGKDCLLGGTNDIDKAQDIALEQANEIFDNPWETNERKFHFLDSLYIVDMETEDPDQMTIETEEQIDNLMSEIHSRMSAEEKKMIKSSTNINPDKTIQKGMLFYTDGFTHEITAVSPDHKTCTVKETWINEDTGKPMKKVTKCVIAKDGDQEFFYDPKYKKYAFDSSDPDGYRWWARMYATGADNYPWSWDDEDDGEGDEYEEEYTPSATAGDYGPGNPWDAPGMSIRDFI